MASLSSQSIASSYEQLLHVDRDGGGNGTTLVDVKDGDNGTTFALKLAQFHAEIRGTTGTGATGAGKLNLSTAELTVVDNDVLGRIDFLAPLESSGTDAILAGASIWGEAEATFAADNNSTALVFATNTSAVATERMRLTSGGSLSIGTASPDGTLHVHTATSGTFAPAAYADDLTIENNADGGLTIATPDANSGYIAFSSPSNNGAYGALIHSSYNSNSEYLSFNTQGGGEVMRLDHNGNVTIPDNLGVGLAVGSTPDAQLNIAKAGSSDNATFNIDTYSSGDSSQSIIGLRKASSNSVSTKTAVVDDEKLGKIAWDGADGDDFDEAASIHAEIDGTPFSSSDDTDMPGALVFGTTADGTGSTAERMRIGSTGTVTITQGTASKALYIDQNANQRALHIDAENTTESTIYVESDALTTGRALWVKSDSSSTGTRNLVEFHNDNASANMTTALKIQQDAPHNALDIDAANTADWAVDIQGTAHTTAGVLYAYSNSSDTGTRDIVHIHNDHASATGATGLKIQQDSTGAALVAMGNVGIGTASPLIDSTASGSSGSFLTVYGSGSDQVGMIELGSTTANSDTRVGAVQFVNNDNSGAGASTRKNIAMISGRTYTDDSNAGDDSGGYMEFATKPLSGSLAINMKIDENSRISLSNNDGNTNNTVFGYRALTNAGTVLGNVGADHNVAVGHLAMGTGNTTTAEQNVAVGNLALEDITTGDHNIAIGSSAGGGITTANSTVFIGGNAGQAVTVTGTSNVNDGTVGIGQSSLTALTSGTQNIAVGFEAMKAQTTGDSNVAVGYQSQLLANNSAADGNVSVGNFTLDGFGDVAVHSLTAIGHAALSGSLTAGAIGTVAVGRDALNSLTSGAENIAVGYQCMDAVDDGAENIAIGFQAMSGETSGKQSIAIGSEALKIANTTSSGTVGNIMIGHNNGIAITTGTRNTVVGAWSMQSNETGTNNTGFGYNALQVCTGGGNTTVGYQAGDGITTGNNNTGIGNAVAFDVDADNQTAVGYQATTDSANDIAIGNTSVDEVKGQVDFSTFSDERIKTDVKDGDLGLDFIKLLKPKKFKKVNPAKYPDSIRKPSDGVDKEGNEFEWTDAQANKVWDGLIAQDVKKAIDACGTSYSGWNEEKNSKQLLTYSTLVIPLIKAVQELSAKVEELEAK